jgi:hypothetical protein
MHKVFILIVKGEWLLYVTFKELMIPADETKL